MRHDRARGGAGARRAIGEGRKLPLGDGVEDQARDLPSSPQVPKTEDIVARFARSALYRSSSIAWGGSRLSKSASISSFFLQLLHSFAIGLQEVAAVGPVSPFILDTRIQ